MIPLVKSTEDLAWYIDDTWSAVVFHVNDNKKIIMDWLHNECKYGVVVAQLNEAVATLSPPPTTSPIKPGSVWGMSLFPSYETVYKAYFCNLGEAMMFKLVWGG